MPEEAKYFQFAYNSSLINAVRIITGEKELYTLHFSNEIPPVKLVALKLQDGKYEWDTVPSGNTQLACSIGKLIEQYYEEHGEETGE